MPLTYEHSFDAASFREQLAEHGVNLNQPPLPGWLFDGLVVYLSDESHGDGAEEAQRREESTRLAQASRTLRFAGARLSTKLGDEQITHVVVDAFPSLSSPGDRRAVLQDLRKTLVDARSTVLPRLVTVQWVEQSWKERTLLDEERKLTSCSHSFPRLQVVHQRC